jgi:hypothetical protein
MKERCGDSHEKQELEISTAANNSAALEKLV